jgi:hypothetical protein
MSDESGIFTTTVELYFYESDDQVAEATDMVTYINVNGAKYIGKRANADNLTFSDERRTDNFRYGFVIQN